MVDVYRLFWTETVILLRLNITHKISGDGLNPQPPPPQVRPWSSRRLRPGPLSSDRPLHTSFPGNVRIPSSTDHHRACVHSGPGSFAPKRFLDDRSERRRPQAIRNRSIAENYSFFFQEFFFVERSQRIRFHRAIGNFF